MDYKNTYDIVILTTACSRSRLHTQVLSNIPEFLSGYKCKWIIRIDQVLGEEVELTVNNFNKILLADNIDLSIHISGNTASSKSWFTSVKFCINEVYKYKPNLGYFWLEDDWSQISTNTLKEVIEYRVPELPSNNFFISFAGRNVLNFNPGIWSRDMYCKYMYNKINNITIHDQYYSNPERACTYTSNRRSEPTDGINMFSFNVFSDVGRKWAADNLQGKRTFHL